MSMTKKYLKTKPICKVRFKIAEEAGETSETVHLVGDFNDWDPQATPMTRFKNGSYATELSLAVDTEYQFKYLVDGESWVNDLNSDKLIPNEFQGENSVVVV